MLAPINKLFEKVKAKYNHIRGYEDLSKQERASYERWEKMLTSDIKVDDLKKHLTTQLALLREMREDEAATPGDRVDGERLAQIRVIKGMLGQYNKAESLKKQAEAEIEQAIGKL